MQKALIVGISNYSTSTVLEGGIVEARAWRSLLTSVYNFPDDSDHIRVRLDMAATRATVLNDLNTWLLPNAARGHQLVFIFAGHGTERWAPGGNGTVAEDALLMYPQANETRLEATIGDSDLAAAVKKAEHPPGTLFTVILDCCSAGGLRIRPKAPAFLAARGNVLTVSPKLPPGTKIQFVPLMSVAEKNRIESRVRIGEFAGPPFVGVTRPIVVAACEDGREAYQPPFTTDPRLYFSSNAITELKGQSTQSYDSFIGNARKRMTAYDQKPTLNGNRLRSINPFLK